MDWRQLLNSRSFFVAVVLVVVAVLGWGLFRAARQSGAEDSGPRSGNPE
jgi:hypothetical protein